MQLHSHGGVMPAERVMVTGLLYGDRFASCLFRACKACPCSNRECMSLHLFWRDECCPEQLSQLGPEIC